MARLKSEIQAKMNKIYALQGLPHVLQGQLDSKDTLLATTHILNDACITLTAKNQSLESQIEELQLRTQAYEEQFKNKDEELDAKHLNVCQLQERAQAYEQQLAYIVVLSIEPFILELFLVGLRSQL